MTTIQWGAVVGALALLVTLVTALIKLAGSMSRLDTTMNMFAKMFDKTDAELCDHDKKINDHETRISVIESNPPRKARAS